MEILETPAAARAWRRGQPGPVGLVPTMGYLHDGHLSLVRRSLAEDAATVVSIFVNPSQFGPNEDFSRYPRDEAHDLAMLGEAGVHAVYLPAVEAVYPTGFQTSVDVERVTQRLEGERRPGHFRGVATVVLKLFNATGADRAYFGRKDAQQLRVIRRMTLDLDLGVAIVPCDIVRERDGLAMSSRNVYLSPEQRAAAPVIQRALKEASAAWLVGERDATKLRGIVERRIRGEPLAEIDYVSVADDVSLDEVEGKATAPVVISLVVRFGATRLLDNVELGLPGGR
ncbi:MAG: pantoate--beta-alanine ligase [Dehalococcoidia bacterium]